MYRKVCCLINPYSGQAAGSTVLEQLKQGAGQYFNTVEVLVTEPNNLARQVKHASFADLILIGGGDGTVSQIVNHLGPSKSAIGILPLGTANDLARELGVTSCFRRDGLDGLLKLYRNCRARPFSLWCLQCGPDFIRRRTFCNYISFGLDAAAVADCQRWRAYFSSLPAVARRFCTRLLYVVAALKHLAKPKWQGVCVRDGRQSVLIDPRTRWRSLFVSNISSVMGFGRVNRVSCPFDQALECQVITSLANYLYMLGLPGSPGTPAQPLGSSETWEIEGLPEGVALQVDGEWESKLQSNSYRISHQGQLLVLAI